MLLNEWSMGVGRLLNDIIRIEYLTVLLHRKR